MDKQLIKLNDAEYPPQPSDPEIIPDSTYWPVTLAFGITFLIWGFLTSLIVSGVGLLFITISLWGWIQELNNEK